MGFPAAGEPAEQGGASGEVRDGGEVGKMAGGGVEGGGGGGG